MNAGQQAHKQPAQHSAAAQVLVSHIDASSPARCAIPLVPATPAPAPPTHPGQDVHRQLHAPRLLLRQHRQPRSPAAAGNHPGRSAPSGVEAWAGAVQGGAGKKVGGKCTESARRGTAPRNWQSKSQSKVSLPPVACPTFNPISCARRRPTCADAGPGQGAVAGEEERGAQHAQRHLAPDVCCGARPHHLPAVHQQRGDDVHRQVAAQQ